MRRGVCGEGDGGAPAAAEGAGEGGESGEEFRFLLSCLPADEADEGVVAKRAKLAEVAFGEIWYCAGQSNMALEAFYTFSADQLKEEVKILKALDHPSVIKLHSVWYERSVIHLVMERCTVF